MPKWNGEKQGILPSLFTKVAIKLSPNLRTVLECHEENTRVFEIAYQDAQIRNSVLERELYAQREDYRHVLAMLNKVAGDLEVAKAPKSRKAPPMKDRLCMPLLIGNVLGYVYGGPYKERPDDIAIGVKMAKEVKKKCEIDVPTVDFSVPDVNAFKLGLLEGLLHFLKHQELFVGCMGGIGRTGLYMAGLAKVAERMDASSMGAVTPKDGLPLCIAYVRQHYKKHAVETGEQIKYITDLDVSGIVSALRAIDITG